MHVKSLGFSCAVVAALCLAAAPASAQGRGHDKDKDHGKDKDQHSAVVDRHNDVPPGLAKKGGLPPGQAKHHYEPDEGVSSLRTVFARRGYTVVRTANSGSSRYVYYRYRNGSIHRAVVSPGTNELGFSNVPSSVLSDLRSMLSH